MKIKEKADKDRRPLAQFVALVMVDYLEGKKWNSHESNADKLKNGAIIWPPTDSQTLFVKHPARRKASPRAVLFFVLSGFVVKLGDLRHEKKHRQDKCIKNNYKCVLGHKMNKDVICNVNNKNEA